MNDDIKVPTVNINSYDREEHNRSMPILQL